MIKKYNEWYWRLYRWFKWEARYLHKDIARGIRNLWRWFPIVWKDRDWDQYYILESLKFKLKNTADYFSKHQRFIGWEDEVKYLRICEKLITKIQNEEYQGEYTKYTSWEKYTNKYPGTVKKVLSNPKYGEYFQIGRGLATAVGMERKLKARKLLFKILEERIERWWD